MSQQYLLEAQNIHKHFAGVYALKDMHFDLKAGEVHALLGENGAGKSTLIKIFSGIYQCDEGKLFVNGEPTVIASVHDANNAGIRTIHQELVLVPHLSIAENIFLGNEISRSFLVSRRSMEEKAQEILDRFDLHIDSRKEVASLTIADQQMVEIIKAVSFDANIIIMDEPTSSLTNNETEKLFELISRLRKEGVGIIYISHRMSELFEIADRVTVMRDGQYVATKEIGDTTADELVSLMVGRDMTDYYIRDFNPQGKEVLRVENLGNSCVHDVSFELHSGEILGFAGLVGAGRTETMLSLVGLDPVKTGKIILNGEEVVFQSPRDALQKRIALVPEDRKKCGFFPIQSIRNNLTLKVLPKFIKGIYVNRQKEDEIANQYFDELSIRASGLDAPLESLSGGNQQKVVLGSWLASEPQILILDEPTRGIDVGAKAEIYTIINDLAKKGVAIIMISSELPEILNMSDRVIVMRDGTTSITSQN
ncbi:MAG: sugar ABC transporter ATP-binding protein [Lachnospiraceae bacterium]|nr:sugar ABC transporter ATP-binding protein [Lachnospiraceae bacterium]